MKSVNVTILVGLPALTGFLAAAVALWISAHRPARKELLAVAVGLAGLSFGGNVLRTAGELETGRPLLAVCAVVVANCSVARGTLGFLRFFSLFPMPITPTLEESRLLNAATEHKRERLQRDLKRRIAIVRRLQGDGLWRFAAATGVLLGGVALVGVLQDLGGLIFIAFAVAFA